MIIDDAHASNTGWPEWLVKIDTAFPSILDRLDRGERLVNQALPDKLTYAMPRNSWFVEAQHEHVHSQPDGSERFFYGQLMHVAQPCLLLDQLFYVRQLAVSRQLNAAKWLLNRSDFVSAMTMYRGILEQVANFRSCLRQVSKIDPNSSCKEAMSAQVDLYMFLKLMLHGTRVDWEKLCTLSADDLFTKKGKGVVEYKPVEHLMDRTAKGVCNDMDKLDREIPGTRTAYEILCEFLHPNVGVCIGVTGLSQAIPAVAEVDTPLMEKTLWSGPPIGFVWEAPELMRGLFDQFAKVLEQFIEDLEAKARFRQCCLGLVQRIIREFLGKNTQFKHPYLPCPCTSGKKIRFCCGSPDQSAVEPSNN